MAIRDASESRLRVNRHVVLVSGSEVRLIEPSAATSQLIGLKALGLLKLPKAWVPEFFVVAGHLPPLPSALERAADLVGMPRSEDVWVRSSGTLEGAQERGSLESRKVKFALIADAISALQASPIFLEQKDRQEIHFVVQTPVQEKKKGHLSNERRLLRQPRDWMYEVASESFHRLGVRKWRNAELKASSNLATEAFAHVPLSLRTVAAWVANARALVEWVWDGAALWVVQLDLLGETDGGVDPQSLVSKAPRVEFRASQLNSFVPYPLEEAPDYRKLSNARLYARLGYTMPTFYVLDDGESIKRILNHGEVTDKLRGDLEVLCEAPFVLRTDAANLPPDKRQMLPRSDELRSGAAAIHWLTSKFRDAMGSIPEAQQIILIGHHYIPAVASAWCQAKPEDRRSRIESLWGIPEGLYCFAHDVFDVDTTSLSTNESTFQSAKILLRRERYKGKFVAPNENGEWKVHPTAVGPDWRRSIARDAWVKEIAWTSRQIAIAEGKPVVVMWLIDIDREQGLNALMPWYHEEWKPGRGTYKKVAPRTKLNSAQIRKIAKKQDWDIFIRDVQDGAIVERLVVDPSDETIIRSRDFVNELAAHAKERGYVVELSGGLLSHFYHMLSREGCDVECVDLFGVTEEAIEFNKLVRDRIPEDIRQHGETVQVYELRGDALITALRRKVVEEAYEVLQAVTLDDTADELADLTEVIDALVDSLRLSRAEIVERRARKNAKRGGFSSGLMLAKTALPPPIAQQSVAVNEADQIRTIRDATELPRLDAGFHVDQRVDQSGVAERQITMTLSAFEDDYQSGEHMFDLPFPNGESRAIFFKAQVERQGATLKLRVRLTRAAQQLTLGLDEPSLGPEKAAISMPDPARAHSRGK